MTPFTWTVQDTSCCRLWSTHRPSSNHPPWALKVFSFFTVITSLWETPAAKRLHEAFLIPSG